MKALFKSVNLIGDALYISAALRAWIRAHDSNWDIYIETINDHTLPLYSGMAQDLASVAVNCEYQDEDQITGEKWNWDFKHTFDVNEAFKLSHTKQQHLAQSYADLLEVDIGKDIGPFFTPLGMLAEWVHDVQKLKDCILISMFSASCASREGKRANKMISWEKWKPMLKTLRDRYKDNPILMLGAPTDKLPVEMETWCHEHYIDRMHGIPLNKLAWIMKGAKLLVTVDNGMSHLAASQKCPTYLFYPKCLGLHYILPIGNPNLVYIHMDPPTVSAAQLNHVLNYACDRFEKSVQR